MEYSFGELVDKLAVIHLKIWHLEDDVQKAKEDNLATEDIEAMFDQVINLNTVRNNIVKSLNRMFEERND